MALRFCVCRKTSAARCMKIALLGLLLMAKASFAQSTDANLPTPLDVRVVEAVIAPRDIGDARLTRHYYVFTGAQGDLEINLTSSNLNGDVDIFTFDNLRPVTKLTMFAGIEFNRVTKSVFIRDEELLLLRVEARTAGDEQGRYRVELSGAFASAPENLLAAARAAAAQQTEEANVEASGTTGRRVSSVGGRLETEAVTNAETAPSIVAAPPAFETDAETSSAPVEIPRTRRRNTRRESARTRRGTSPPRPPRVPRRARAESTEPQPAVTQPSTEKSATATAEARENETRTQAESAADAPSQLPGLRLVIETKDGRRLERAMSNIKRVTVTNGELVIVTNTNRVERLSMKTILRVAVEP